MGDTEKLHEPLHWKKPKRIFVNSMGDLFHDDVPFEFIDKVMAVIGRSQNHNLWIGVTVENQEMADKRIPILLQIPAAVRFVKVEPMLGPVELYKKVPGLFGGEGWLSYPGPKLCKEPSVKLEGINWVICGGETGPGARPMHPDWVRSLRDQCQAAGVPFFFKGWGEWAPVQRNNDSNQIYVRDGLFVTAKKFACLDKQGRDVLDLPGLWNEGVDMAFVGKKVAGDILDGKQYHELPEVAKGL